MLFSKRLSSSLNTRATLKTTFYYLDGVICSQLNLKAISLFPRHNIKKHVGWGLTSPMPEDCFCHHHLVFSFTTKNQKILFGKYSVLLNLKYYVFFKKKLVFNKIVKSSSPNHIESYIKKYKLSYFPKYFFTVLSTYL